MKIQRVDLQGWVTLQLPKLTCEKVNERLLFGPFIPPQGKTGILTKSIG